jgi:hypothetical protein
MNSVKEEVKNAIQDNLVYHASPLKFDKLEGNYTSSWSGEKGNVFVTPYKGAAINFIVDRQKLIEAIEDKLKTRIRETRFKYDAWDKPVDKLRGIPKAIGVTVEGAPHFEPIKGESTGYLYTIDYDKYKDNAHMFNKSPNSNIEFLLEGDVTPDKVTQHQIKWVLKSAIRNRREADKLLNKSKD